MNGAENIEIDNNFIKTVCNHLHNKFDRYEIYILFNKIVFHSNYDLCNKNYIFQNINQFYRQFNTSL